MAPDQRTDDQPDRARSFGAVARAYAEHRPGYPDAAVRWALAPLGEPASRAGLRVLDLAAGTGKLTECLLGVADDERIAEVIAVEPDPAMLAELTARLPGVRALAGTAEAIPLPDGSVDAVLIGQALHWMDPRQAAAQFVRVLRPGGVVAALWNDEDHEVEWIQGYREAVGWARLTGRTGRAVDDRPRFAADPGLGPTETAQFDNPVPTSRDALLRQLTTFSWISTMPERERRATVERARAYLAGRAELGEVFELPLRTLVLRAVSRAASRAERR